MITTEEKDVLDITVDIFNKFQIMPQLHPDDLTDFKYHVHAIQNLILCRSAYRVLHNLETKEPSY